MKIFEYKARDKFGKAISGSVRSENRDKAIQHLAKLGHVVTTLGERKKNFLTDKLGFFNRIKSEDINLFTRQLATLIAAGLPIVKGLSVIKEQLKNQRFKEVVGDLVQTIEGGGSLSDALDSYVDIFGTLYVGTVRAGEASGSLDEILERLADLGEHTADVQAKIKVATRYPIFAISILGIAVIILSTFVIPMFANLFSQFGSRLPLPTRILMAFSNFMNANWPIIFLGIFGLIIWIRYYVRTKSGKVLWDRLKLKLPIFGPLILQLTVSQFTRITAILTRSGIPVVKAFEMVGEATDNAVVKEETKKIIDDVIAGKRIAEPMRVSGLFPTMLVEMASVGEETGRLDHMLFYVSDYLDKRSDYTIKNLTTMIEPFLIVFLGGVVLLLALAIFLPMWDMIGIIKG